MNNLIEQTIIKVKPLKQKRSKQHSYSCDKRKEKWGTEFPRECDKCCHWFTWVEVGTEFEEHVKGGFNIVLKIGGEYFFCPQVNDLIKLKEQLSFTEITKEKISGKTKTGMSFTTCDLTKVIKHESR